MGQNNKLISVLIPTRGRVSRLERCLNSFNEKTENKDLVELIVKADTDDIETINFLNDYTISIKSQIDCKIIISERDKGYGSLHHFYNEMVKISSGEFLYIFNDDIRMETDGWENLIIPYSGKFIVLAHNTFVDKNSQRFKRTGSDIFTPKYNGNPIFPKTLYNLWGFVSDHQLVDHWFVTILQQLGWKGKNIEHWIDIRCFTDRPDGIDASTELDATFSEGRKHINWDQNEQKKENCVRLIIEYLNSHPEETCYA